MRRVHFYHFSDEVLMKRNNKPKMIVLYPYKKTGCLVSLIYAEDTPGHWHGTLTRNKKYRLKTQRQTSLTDIPVSCLQQLPKTKPIFIAASSRPRHCPLARSHLSSTAHGPHLPVRDTANMLGKRCQVASVETPRNALKRRCWSPRYPGGVSRSSRSGAGSSGSFGKGQGGIEQWNNTQAWMGRTNELGTGHHVESVNPGFGFRRAWAIRIPSSLHHVDKLLFLLAAVCSAFPGQGLSLCCPVVLDYLRRCLFPLTFLPCCVLAFPKALPAVLGHGLSFLARALQPRPTRLGQSWDPKQGCHPAEHSTPAHQACYHRCCLAQCNRQLILGHKYHCENN